MRRFTVLIGALAIVAAACSSSSAADTPSAASDGATEQRVGAADGPAAADFTLALGDGSTFTLSEEQKPVYLIFWAEW
jgi:cytochrome oxidase Cu insertion factor (SCO1/SenC/PrrC family)